MTLASVMKLFGRQPAYSDQEMEEKVVRLEERRQIKLIALRELLNHMWKLPKDPSRAEVRQWVEDRLDSIERTGY